MKITLLAISNLFNIKIVRGKNAPSVAYRIQNSRRKTPRREVSIQTLIQHTKISGKHLVGDNEGLKGITHRLAL
jgi:hypothetical protein